ncbi:ATP-binding protein [Candidatus Gottesmanbacteria bacterium]|nr:ATP-binding protein [Candidatus Gottesmanbacteria bacterium]
MSDAIPTEGLIGSKEKELSYDDLKLEVTRVILDKNAVYTIGGAYKVFVKLSQAEKEFEKVVGKNQERQTDPAKADKYRLIIENLQHDFPATSYALQEKELAQFYFGDKIEDSIPAVLLRIPAMVAERLKRDGTDEIVNYQQSINQTEALSDVANFFTTYITDLDRTEKMDPKSVDQHVFVNIDKNIKLNPLSGNEIDFYLALFNIARNSQKRITGTTKSGYNMSFTLRDDNGQTVVEIADDAGGYSDDMLAYDSEVKKPKAFMRGQSEGVKKGKGYGLDMVWKTFVDDMGAEILINNPPFQFSDGKTGDKGAITTIKFPKR